MGSKPRSLPGAAAESGVAVAVVDGALVGVGEHGVGFADFLEFFFRVGIVGIAVGMKLQRELAIGALEFQLRDGAGHAQHFVVIAFCVRGQNKPFFKNTKSWASWGRMSCNAVSRHPRLFRDSLRP